MTLIQKIISIYVAYRSLPVFGSSVQTKGSEIVCAPWSQIQDAMTFKNFTLPNWVAVEELCEERVRPLVFRGQKTLSSTYVLMTKEGKTLMSSSNAREIHDWVKAHENNTPAYSPENQCSLMVSYDRYGYCAYSDFIPFALTDPHAKHPVHVNIPWVSTRQALVDRLERDCVRPNCP